MQRYIGTVGKVKDGCNVVGVVSGLIGSVQCVRGVVYVRDVRLSGMGHLCEWAHFGLRFLISKKNSVLKHFRLIVFIKIAYH